MTMIEALKKVLETDGTRECVWARAKKWRGGVAIGWNKSEDEWELLPMRRTHTRFLYAPAHLPSLDILEGEWEVLTPDEFYKRWPI